MNFIDLFSFQSVVTLFFFFNLILIFLFFSMLRVRTILNVALHFLYMLTVSFVYTLYKVYISLQHFVLILHKILYHRQ